MKLKQVRSLAVTAAIGVGSLFAQAQGRLVVDASSPVSTVSPTLYGLMTEEINYSYDGGLYAEMIRNRALTYRWPRFENWRAVQHGDGDSTLIAGKDGPSAALPHSMVVKVTRASAANEAGVANEGYWGMGVVPSTKYAGSFYGKSASPVTAHVRLVADETGATLAQAAVKIDAASWKQYSYTMDSKAGFKPGTKNHFELTFAEPTEVSLQLVLLFPPTFHGRANGNRPDLMAMLAAMRPTFLRFPGGNYLEGQTIKDYFAWKKTLGPLVNRPTHVSPWRYQSSDGMGLLEFLEWCEDLKIEPVLAVFAGYTLDRNSIAGTELQPYVDEALEEIEYVTGDTSTKWGAERARDGHPAPFALRYVEIGNEDNLDRSGSYVKRYPPFEKAIRERFPQLKIIATAWEHGGHPDLVDDHYYRRPQEFFELIHTYDKTDRNGPKIFVGEWATRTGTPTPDFGAALGDAAWMTSMERNSDIVVMAAYAPLFTNVNSGGMQWYSDLIGYDALKSYGSPSYWAQVMFAAHIGDHTVKSSGEGLDKRLFWSATTSRGKKLLYLKLVNASEKPQTISFDLKGTLAATAPVESLHGGTWWVTNTIDSPDTVKPVQSSIKVAAGAWSYTVPANTIQAIDIPLK